MKYFIDAEFLEGTQKKWYGKTPPTIDLISIGIVAEDGREYYTISKDFNLKEAWNRYDIKQEWYSIDESTQSTRDIKVYWIRDNVLKPIFDELYILQYKESCKLGAETSLLLNGFEKKNNLSPNSTNHVKFTYNNLRTLIDKYGKTNKQIAEEVVKFTKPVQNIDKNIPEHIQIPEQFKIDYSKPQFYGYYCDYDWVVFCWLFGKMIDLPTGFPKYCIDLKQVLDEQEDIRVNTPGRVCGLKGHPNYPKQTNEHNALADARFNRDLFNFLNTI